MMHAIDKRIRDALAGLRLAVEIVSDIVMDASGVARCKGVNDHELESAAAWHFGFYSRPKDGARGVVLKADGKGNTSFLICYRDRQYELALEKGEVGIANAFGAKVLLDKDGNVIVQDGTKGIARKDDAVRLTNAMLLWMQQVEGFINAMASGTVTPQIATFQTAVGSINEASTKATCG